MYIWRSAGIVHLVRRSFRSKSVRVPLLPLPLNAFFSLVRACTYTRLILETIGFARFERETRHSSLLSAAAVDMPRFSR